MKLRFAAFSLWLVLHAGAAPSKPNIVFIISDDQGWEDYGFMGHPRISTPRLDRLAAESLTFKHGYSPVPLCRPSLATMITGLYPHQHGVTGNDPALPDKGVNPQTGRTIPKYDHYYQTIIRNFESRPNLVRQLTESGYRSLQTGKWWEGDPKEAAGFSQAMTGGTGKGDRHGGKGLEIGREGIQPIRDFINGVGEKPFLVWYAPMLPHAPHNPPQELIDKYSKFAPGPVASYWASVEWFDRTCGELLDFLDEKKLRQNTIIVYVCDNGWIQNPDRANQFAPRSKLTPYEGGVRTPIMISWPAGLKPRMDDEHLASSIDLWPTLAALLETPIPAGLPGIDLTDDAALKARTTIYGEQYPHNIADVNYPAAGVEHVWIIDDGWKLILPKSGAGGNGPEIYHLRDDPWEKTELSASQPEKVKQLSARLEQWWSATAAKPAGK